MVTFPCVPLEKSQFFNFFNIYFYTLKTLLSFLLSKLKLEKIQIFDQSPGLLGGVYMRKLAPVQVSSRHDFLISYRVYMMMTGLFHISLFEGTLHVDKMHI